MGLDKLQELFDKHLRKIADLEDFVSLIGEKSKYINQLHQIQTKNGEQKQLLELCKGKIDQFRTVDIPLYNRVIQEMKNQQLITLAIMEALDNKFDDEFVIARKDNNNYSKVSVHQAGLLTPICEANNHSESKSSRMLLSDYKNSPFVRRMRPVSLKFVDFEATIKQSDFDKIPAYMKGRDAIDELRDFLEHVIIKCFTQKYTLFYKQREVVKNPHDLTLWKLYHKQEVEHFPGRKFITQGDISNLTQRMIDKKTTSRITMLRHISIIQEIRKNATVYYIWINQ